jgi:TetR/AcrR family transcriptional regulator, copper-responsive repressor
MRTSKNLLPCSKKTRPAVGRGRPRCFDLEKALDHAMLLFWQKGFRETSLDEIAQTIGVKKPSLYAAFGDKEMLFRKVVQRYSQKFSQPEIRALQDHDDIREALDAFFDRGIAFAFGQETPRGCLLATAFADSALLPPQLAWEIKAIVRKADRLIAQRLAKAVQAGQLPADFDIKNSAKFLNSLMHGLALRARAGERKSDLQRVKEMALRCIR